MSENFKPKTRPRISPEELISSISYGTIGVNDIDQEEIEAVGYYLEELNHLKNEDSCVQQLENQEKEIEKLNENIEWYKMWHNKFKKEIENLQTELETYRPTKLKGNGQCSCYRCKQEKGFSVEWTDWCSKYKGHVYCDSCLAKILKEEQSQNQTANSIELKFKIGDKCWAIRNATNIYDKPKQVLIKEIKITKNCIKYYAKNGCCSNFTNKTTMHLQSQLFATEEDALKKLEELKNEKH